MNYSRALLEETVINRITQLFPDMQEIELASVPYRKKVNLDMSALQIILYDLNNDRINFKQYTIAVMDKILNTSLLQSKDEIILQYTFEVYYKTIIVLYMSYLPQNQIELFQTPEELYDMYPEYRFENTYENDLWCDLTKAATRLRKKRTDAAVIERYLLNMHSTEIDLLLIFRNFMRLCLMMIPPEGNKNILLKVVAKLEGAGQSYITGGDPRPATRRRIRVYEKESGIKAKRKNSSSSQNFAPSNVIPSSGDGSSSGGAGLLSLLVESGGGAEMDRDETGSQNGTTNSTNSNPEPPKRSQSAPLIRGTLFPSFSSQEDNTNNAPFSSLAQAAAAMSSASYLTLPSIPSGGSSSSSNAGVGGSLQSFSQSGLLTPTLSSHYAPPASPPPLTTSTKKARPVLDDFTLKYSLSDLMIPDVPELECLLYSCEVNCSDSFV